MSGGECKRAGIWPGLFLLLLAFTVRAEPAAPAIDAEWRERFVMGYYADVFRDRGLAQKRALEALEATRTQGSTVVRLRAAARYFLAMDADQDDCQLIDEYMALARSVAAQLPRDLFDVAAAVAGNAPARPCAGQMPIEELEALAQRLGDPARQFFVLEARAIGLHRTNRYNDAIALHALELNYAVAPFQEVYAMLTIAQAELVAKPKDNRAREWLARARGKVSAREFPALETALQGLSFRVAFSAGDQKAALAHMKAAEPGMRRGVMGARDSAFQVIAFARALNHMGRHDEALAMLDDGRADSTPSKTLDALRSVATLEILIKASKPDSYARGLREIHNIETLLRDTETFGPQRVKSYKNVISQFLQKHGRYEAALKALREAIQAAETVQRIASETARVELQEKLNVAAKEQENARLRADAELQSARQRVWIVAFAVAMAGVAAAGGALGLAVRRGRRLTKVSAELELRNSELEQRSASRIRLLAAACHDLRQPAHALGMLAELGQDAQREPARFGAWLQSVRRSAGSLSEMLDELMDLGRLDGGKYEPQISDVSLAELLQEVALHFQGLAQRKGLLLEVSAAQGHVVSDGHLLRRIVFNLVANAVKYTDVGVVRVNVHREGDVVHLTVQDTGPGIPPDRLDDVFRDYVRLNPTKAAEGLGVGLSIVRRAAELLGHELALVSPPGEGTTASLRLPCSLAPQASTAAAEPAAPPPNGGVIALLEDDADVCQAMEALLRRWGYVVHTGSDVQAVLGQMAVHELKPQLLISDLHLGHGNGLEELARLREALQDPELPALLVTGDMDTTIAPLAAAAGVRLAHKPLAPGKLAELVRSCIRPPSVDTARPGPERHA